MSASESESGSESPFSDEQNSSGDDFEMVERSFSDKKHSRGSQSSKGSSQKSGSSFGSSASDESTDSDEELSECASDTTLYGMIEANEPFACLQVMI